MAVFPCSRCGQRYLGPQQTAYPAVCLPGVTYQERLRLCPTCMSEVINHPAWQLVDVDEVVPPITVCGMCDSAVVPNAIFCTYYEHGQQRADLYGRLCANGCVPKFLDHVWGSSEAWETALAR